MNDGANLLNIPWYGGKAYSHKWIISKLPWSFNSSFIEPFCGSATITLNRMPVNIEVLNDKNERVINWLRCIRDHKEEVKHKVKYMPYSRAEYNMCFDRLDDRSISDVDRAVAFYVSVTQGFIANDTNRGWLRPRRSGSHARTDYSTRIMSLADRLMNIYLECGDAIEILDYYTTHEDSVVYCDPPYYTSNTSIYQHGEFDVGKMTEIVSAAKAKVAISGYEDEWDHLDWNKSERTMYVSQNLHRDQIESKVECLWYNYDLEADFGLFA